MREYGKLTTVAARIFPVDDPAELKLQIYIKDLFVKVIKSI